MARPLGPARAAVWSAAVAALLAAGCARRSESHYARVQLSRQAVMDGLTGKGAKLELKTYPQGSAYAVTMTGLTVTDEMLEQLPALGNITELNLSKSTVTDAHMDQINKVSGLWLLRLDLSHTAVTDAGFEKLTGAFLTNLNLAGTKVTPAAVDRFKKKRLTEPGIMDAFRKPAVQL
jgi:hypothetical protein